MNRERTSTVVECQWYYEDELPRTMGEEEYTRMFESSRVIDGVRMFPAIVVGGVVNFVMGYDDELTREG